MDPETTLTQVTEEDLRIIEAELAASPKPAALRQLAEKLAYHKTSGQRTQAVKRYEPRCLYRVGDQILKVYDEHLTVSSKTAELFQGSVVLTVVNKVLNPGFQCEMLEVDYIGGGTFRRYIDYMKKSHAQVFLPANVGGGNVEPEVVPQEDDPRLSELPVTDRDLKALERNLRTALHKSPVFFSWNDHWQLSRGQVEIPEEKIKEAEAHIQETGRPASTEDLVRKLFGLEPSSAVFDIHALSLNHVLEKKHKKEFVFMSPLGWGRWHLKKSLNAIPVDLALTAPQAKVPELEKGEPLESSIIPSFPLKVYLTWREVLSGGIRIPRSLHRELAHSREYILTEAEEGKDYPVYFFPNYSCFLGLQEFYAANNIPQGTSLTLERKDQTHFQFWVKKSKKKLTVPRLAYDAGLDLFHDAGEEVFTYALPNKSIFIEKDVLAGLLAAAEQRAELDLHDLLLLVFKSFSPEPSSFSQHFLRAFHLVDILKRTSQEDVESVLLNSSQFLKSEKKKGIFTYKSPVEAKPEEEKRKERAPVERARATPRWEGEEEDRDQLPIGMIEEDFLQGEEAAEEGGLTVIEPEAEEIAPPVRIPAAGPAPRPAPLPRQTRETPAAPPAKKEKAVKKKKPKPESERAPRVRKSEKRVIEEKIELEESELEALSAIKAAEVESAEEPALIPEGEEVEAGEAPSPEKPEEAAAVSFGGLFGEKLKSALVKKKPEEKPPAKEKAKPKKK